MGSNYYQINKELESPFIIEVDTTIAGASGVGKFTIPLDPYPNGIQAIIDWGDGVLESVTAETTHDYVAAAGTGSSPYTVKVYKRFDFRFGDLGDKLKLTKVKQWGNSLWYNFQGMFGGCSNMVYEATDTPNTFFVTNYKDMFLNCSSFDTNLNSWDFSKATLIDRMLFGCSSFDNDGVALSMDLGSATDITQLFASCSTFNQTVTLTNTIGITKMQALFQNCTVFNNGEATDTGSIPLVLDTSTVEDLSRIFQNCSNFNQPLQWDTSECLIANSLFQLAVKFNQPLATSGSVWDVSKVTNMNRMFNISTAFDQNLGNWDVQSVTDIDRFMDGATPTNFSAFNLDAIYNGWSLLPSLSTGEMIRFGTAKYNASAQAGRDILTNAPNNWVILDGGQV